VTAGSQTDASRPLDVCRNRRDLVVKSRGAPGRETLAGQYPRIDFSRRSLRRTCSGFHVNTEIRVRNTRIYIYKSGFSEFSFTDVISVRFYDVYACAKRVDERSCSTVRNRSRAIVAASSSCPQRLPTRRTYTDVAGHRWSSYSTRANTTDVLRFERVFVRSSACER